MKLNYSSLQHAVLPVEGARAAASPLGRPVAVISPARPARAAGLGVRVRRARARGWASCRAPAGALPGGHSHVVRELRERGLLAGFLTAGAAYGGEGEAITTAGALHHGLSELGWDAAVCGPGPGIIGSASALGHGGMSALDNAHAAAALGAPVVLCPRMSSGDPRERHAGSRTTHASVLELLLSGSRSGPVVRPARQAARRRRRQSPR